MLNWQKVLSPFLAFSYLTSMAAVQAAAQPSVSAPAKSEHTLPSIPFEKYKLKNGLEVILSEDHKLPLVSVNLWYHVGPANEREGLTGFAHLFEHMMFEGSRHVGAKAHFKYLESAGASDINGTTDFDRTNYFETLPSNQLELALWLESDRMGFLRDTLDKEKLANQRDVVRNERRQSVENHPYGIVEEEMFHQLFPKGHPYYASVIGSHADIEAARLDHLRDFFKQYYSPSNASLAIVGDFDKAKAKALVEKYFGTLQAGPPVPKITIQTPPITAEKKVTVADQVELPRVYMSWITAPIYKSGSAEADLIARILGGGKSGRLFKKLVYEKQIAQDVTVENYPLLLGSVFTIKATAKPGVKPEDLQKEIDAELQKFRQDGATQRELDGARNTIEAKIVGDLENLGGFGGVADRLNNYNHFIGDPDYLSKDLQRYDTATLADLKKVTDSYLQNNSRVVVFGVPGKKVLEDVPQAKEESKDAEKVDAVAESPDEAWRKEAPKPSGEVKLNLPVPESFKLSNGLTVYLLERHNLPIISAQLSTLSGTERNPVDKPGLAAFTASMLDEGTKKRSTLQIADDLEQLGTFLVTMSGVDSSRMAMRTLSKTAEPAFEIFSDLLLNSAFEQKEIDRVRSMRITSLEQEKDDANALARRVVYRKLYGANSPYGYEDDGTVFSLKNISRDDLVKFWKTEYTPSNAALVIAGDLTKEQAKTIAEKYLGSWTGAGTSHVPPVVENNTKRQIFVVNKDAAPQTAVIIASIGLARSNPDYVPVLVMNNVLGGMFSSRLNMNLREKHGYTYGTYSRFSARRAAGPFSASAGIRTNVTGPAISEYFKEFDGMRSNPPSAEEVKMAKDSYALSLPGDFETSLNVVNQFSNLFVYNLPVDYYKNLPDKVYAVTPAEAESMVKKYLDPNKMVVVTVGDKAKIMPELEKLNLGPIQELNAEANPIH